MLLETTLQREVEPSKSRMQYTGHQYIRDSTRDTHFSLVSSNIRSNCNPTHLSTELNT